MPELNETTLSLWLLSCLAAYSAYVMLTAGAFSFAYVAFIALGGYGSAIAYRDLDFSLVESLLVAPVVAGAVALVLAKPLERLSGIYLAIASVSLVGLVQVLLTVQSLFEVTGGPAGISGVPIDIELWYLVAAVAVAAVLARQTEHSGLGRAIRMMRVDPLVAGTLGVNVRRIRLWLFAASAAVAAVAGVMRAHYYGYVAPSDYGFDLVVLLLAMVIIGGVGSWIGPLIGAAIFTLIPEWLAFIGQWRDVFTGLLLLVIVIVSREGLAGAAGLAWYRLRRKRRTSSQPEPAPATATPAEPEVAATRERSSSESA